MDYSEEQLAVISAQQDNILAITSVCNLRCKFCSHQGNPQEVKTFSSGHRSLEEVKRIMEFLSSNRKIVIGESATKISEGEPFTHPDFKEIIRLLRAKFPDTTIQITTNGSRLTSDNIELLKEINNIELNISLNTSTVDGRLELMNDYSAEVVLAGIKKLNDLNINYHGSIVAMPHVIGWDNLEETIAYFDKCNAQTIRVFLPGYTKYSPSEIKFDLKLWSDLEEFISNCNSRYQVPVILEPAQIDDLKAKVVGLIKDSPAAKSQLKDDDQILSLDGQEVKTRVDAFHRLVKAENPKLKVQRGAKEYQFRIEKEAGIKSGAVLHYDLNPELFSDLKRLIHSYQAQEVLLLTSKLAKARLNLLVDYLDLDKIIQVIAVPSEFFGGSILTAGLLTVDDFEIVLKNYQQNLADLDLVLLPEVAFDFRGFDLTGVSYHKLEEELDLNIELLA